MEAQRRILKTANATSKMLDLNPAVAAVKYNTYDIYRVQKTLPQGVREAKHYG